jgi:hypothetical protein
MKNTAAAGKIYKIKQKTVACRSADRQHFFSTTSKEKTRGSAEYTNGVKKHSNDRSGPRAAAIKINKNYQK